MLSRRRKDKKKDRPAGNKFIKNLVLFGGLLYLGSKISGSMEDKKKRCK